MLPAFFPTLSLQLGDHTAAYDAALAAAEGSRLVERIWARDHTEWSESPREISNRLGWLDVAERMRPEAAALTLFARQLQREGFTQALLLGMGGSSLAPEVFSRLLAVESGIKLGVLDSTDPEYIRQHAATYDPAHTVYIVSTKSGGTVETLSLFKYFYNQVALSLRENAGSSLRGREAAQPLSDEAILNQSPSLRGVLPENAADEAIPNQSPSLRGKAHENAPDRSNPQDDLQKNMGIASLALLRSAPLAKTDEEALAKTIGQRFIAITDPGSSLTKLAEQYHFRNLFLADPNIGGRYSALSHFGLVPAALVGADLGALLERATAAAAACKQPVAENPAAQLGLALGALAKAGCDKATLLASGTRVAFGNWAEQLIAESTGKHGTGILPVVGEPVSDIADYGDDRVFIALGKLDGPEAGLLAAARAAGRPVIELSWDDDYALGAQIFMWEFATAVAGHVMGIHPFDQPDVEAAKVQGRTFVDEYSRSGALPAGQQQALSAPALSTFLHQAAPGDYVALQAYATPSAALDEALQALRRVILRGQHVASTAGYGPRFLHSTGQLHKGDSGRGLFVQFVTQPPTDDLPIPDEAGAATSNLSFGVLKAAQALGDAAALRAAGRRVLSFSVTGDLAWQLAALVKELG